MSRLTIDMTEQQHQSLKALAALEGKTIKQYTIERLFPGGRGCRPGLAGAAGPVEAPGSERSGREGHLESHC